MDASDPQPTDSHSSDGPLSLKRLTAAFAQMLGPREEKAVAEAEADSPAPHREEVSPRSIVEGILFVGAEQARPRSAEELAGVMRDVTPDEVATAVAELNTAYQRDESAFHIAGDERGYVLELRPELRRLQDRCNRRLRETKLSQAAMEVLSIVAYKQPIEPKRVDQMRGKRSASLLASLVRRGLVRVDRPDDAVAPPAADPPGYVTTDRFLRLFGVESVAHLPRAAEMDD